MLAIGRTRGFLSSQAAGLCGLVGFALLTVSKLCSPRVPAVVTVLSFDTTLEGSDAFSGGCLPRWPPCCRLPGLRPGCCLLSEGLAAA